MHSHTQRNTNSVATCWSAAKCGGVAARRRSMSAYIKNCPCERIIRLLLVNVPAAISCQRVEHVVATTCQRHHHWHQHESNDKQQQGGCSQCRQHGNGFVVGVVIVTGKSDTTTCVPHTHLYIYIYMYMCVRLHHHLSICQENHSAHAACDMTQLLNRSTIHMFAHECMCMYVCIYLWKLSHFCTSKFSLSKIINFQCVFSSVLFAIFTSVPLLYFAFV